MNTGESPRMECEFDRSTGRWLIKWFNCPSETAERSAVEKRIADITKQLSTGRGPTNRERRELARERRFLEKQFTQGKPPHSRLDDPRKMKAAEKKLRWLGRKADQKTFSIV